MPSLRSQPRRFKLTQGEGEETEMALQWVILAYVVAAEAAVAILLTLPAPKIVRKRIVALVSLLLQPAATIVPFILFQLLGTLCPLLFRQ